MKNQKTRHDSRGFTLIELVVVIAILAVLVTIIVPKLVGFLGRADNISVITDVRAVQDSSNFSSSTSTKGLTAHSSGARRAPATSTPLKTVWSATLS